MNIKTILLTIAIALFSGSVLSGSGHDHGHGHSHEPVTQQQAEQIASRMVSSLTKNGVIDKTWGGTKVEKSEQKTFDGRPEWVVSYKNEKVSDLQKRTLYIFLTLTGEYLAANYTGQ
jgi:hypothetical protein